VRLDLGGGSIAGRRPEAARSRPGAGSSRRGLEHRDRERGRAPRFVERRDGSGRGDVRRRGGGRSHARTNERTETGARRRREEAAAAAGRGGRELGRTAAAATRKKS
jgi:hypothetical protein